MPNKDILPKGQWSEFTVDDDDSDNQEDSLEADLLKSLEDFDVEDDHPDDDFDIDEILSEIDDGTLESEELAVKESEEVDESEIEVDYEEEDQEEDSEEDEDEEELVSEDEDEPVQEEDSSPRAQRRIVELANQKRLAEQRIAELEAKLASEKQSTHKATLENLQREGDLIDSKISRLRELKKVARQSGDDDALDQYDDELAQARLDQRVNQARLAKMEEEEPVNSTASPPKPAQSTQPSLPPAAESFVAEYGERIFSDAELTQALGMVSNQMTREGADWNDPKTYNELSTKMAVFRPDVFKKVENKVKEEKKTKKKKTSSPKSKPKLSTSSKNRPNQKTNRKKSEPKLSAADIRFAKEMGIDPKEYLKEKIRYKRAEERKEELGGSPWVNID